VLCCTHEHTVDQESDMHRHGSMMYLSVHVCHSIVTCSRQQGSCWSRTKGCLITYMWIVNAAFKELHLSYKQLSEASSHGPDSKKKLTLESCWLHESVAGHAAAPTGCTQNTATCSHQVLSGSNKHAAPLMSLLCRSMSAA